MSQSRELREKLEETQAELRRAKEHLEKLRAYQARERDSLRQQLEAAQREVAGLRGRLQEDTPVQGVEPRQEVEPGEKPPQVSERSDEATTALVALARHPASLDQAMPALSRLLKLAPVDVRFRLAPLSPVVVARLPVDQAGELRAALRAEGFLAVSHPVPPRAAGPLIVKRFVFEEQALSVEGAQGESLRVQYAAMRLIMRGRSITTQVETQNEVETHHHGYRQHRVHRMVETQYERVENFLWVLGKGARLAFTQATHFTGLGDQRAPSVFENLQRLANELRRRAPHVVLDERCLQKPGFVLQFVDPDRSQELLSELIFQAVEEGLWS